MAYDMQELRDATMAAKPIQDKLSRGGECSLSADEASKLARAMDSFQRYLDSM